jgi:hypothetical protein
MLFFRSCVKKQSLRHNSRIADDPDGTAEGTSAGRALYGQMKGKHSYRLLGSGFPQARFQLISGFANIREPIRRNLATDVKWFLARA